MENFIMIPNKLIWNNEDRTKTYTQEYGDKILHIFSYLQRMTNNFGETYFTMEDMIINCGLKVDTHKGKSFSQFKDILIDLKKKDIIETTIDFDNIKVVTLIKCKFNMPIEKSNGKNTRFFNVPHKSYLAIMDNYIGKLNKMNLLKTYYYISSRLSRREIKIVDGKKRTNDIRAFGGKAECFYDSYEAICKDIDVNENTWGLYIKELNEIGLLYYDNVGIVKKNKESHSANNVYCIKEAELVDALKQSKLFYISSGYQIIGKKANADLKVIQGLKGKIQSEQNKNKDTSKLESKKEKLELKNAKKNNDSEFEINKLLEENDGEILSSIWDGTNDKTADRWYKLEVDLGLIDEETNELLTDYEYYKWTVTHYIESKHDYYANCVSKHIRENKEVEVEPKHKGLFGAIKVTPEPIKKLDETIIDSQKKDKMTDISLFIIDKYSDSTVEIQSKYDEKFKGLKWFELSATQTDHMFNKVTEFFNGYANPF
ncbi:hypothetical protein [Clostridium lacusfryxellense]|uniref:hypothetical protein n=1 Tax=Clostridium lacusfryxellense TaxID=205328 RepID=UPI001C0DE076|nr:hypothetical protein [Clostridium lacusfryxellense]MBU3112139.1 hypothetical protein [Clostridium lacusfryxellense]